MKKHIILFSSLFVASLLISVLAMTAFADDEKPLSLEERVATLEEENATMKNMLAEILELLKIPNDSETEESQEETVNKDNDISDTNSLEGLLLYDDENISITYSVCEKAVDRGYRKDSYPNNVVFIVENKTDISLTFEDESLAVDGWSLNHIYCHAEIAPQSKGYAIFGCNDEIPTLTPERVSGSFCIQDRDQEIFKNHFNYFSFDTDNPVK